MKKREKNEPSTSEREEEEEEEETSEDAETSVEEEIEAVPPTEVEVVTAIVTVEVVTGTETATATVTAETGTERGGGRVPAALAESLTGRTVIPLPPAAATETKEGPPTGTRKGIIPCRQAESRSHMEVAAAGAVVVVVRIETMNARITPYLLQGVPLLMSTSIHLLLVLEDIKKSDLGWNKEMKKTS